MPPLTRPALCFTLFAAAVIIWIAWTVAMTSRDRVQQQARQANAAPASKRDAVLLALVLLPFVPYVVGVLRYDWGFNELSALFLLAGFAVGLVAGRNLSETAARLLKGMEGMLAAALFVGIARAISVALSDGQVLDTILYSLAAPLSRLPGLAAAMLMVPAQALLHVPVPSVSGQY